MTTTPRDNHLAQVLLQIAEVGRHNSRGMEALDAAGQMIDALKANDPGAAAKYVLRYEYAING